jgi:hypothetical protein
MSERRAISIYMREGQAGIFLLLPTGVVWSTQTAGIACHHPEAEGIYIPFNESAVSFPHLGCYGDPEPSVAAEVQAAIHALGWPLTVDHERWSEAEEAWWPVVVVGEARRTDGTSRALGEYDELFSCVGLRGWLTTENCD